MKRKDKTKSVSKFLDDYAALAAIIVMTMFMFTCGIAAVVHGKVLLAGIYLAASIFLSLPIIVAFREKR